MFSFPNPSSFMPFDFNSNFNKMFDNINNMNKEIQLSVQKTLEPMQQDLAKNSMKRGQNGVTIIDIQNSKYCTNI